MRMWNVDPKFMCREHLLGEHVEMHMFVGTFKRKMKIDGYILNGLVEPENVKQRHDILVKEMEARGYNHKSPIEVGDIDISYLPKHIQEHKIETTEELFNRCPQCTERRKRFGGEFNRDAKKIL